MGPAASRGPPTPLAARDGLGWPCMELGTGLHGLCGPSQLYGSVRQRGCRAPRSHGRAPHLLPGSFACCATCLWVQQKPPTQTALRPVAQQGKCRGSSAGPPPQDAGQASGSAAGETRATLPSPHPEKRALQRRGWPPPGPKRLQEEAPSGLSKGSIVPGKDHQHRVPLWPLSGLAQGSERETLLRLRRLHSVNPSLAKQVPELTPPVSLPSPGQNHLEIRRPSLPRLPLTSLIRCLTGLWPPPTPHTLSKRLTSCLIRKRTAARSRAALQEGRKETFRREWRAPGPPRQPSCPGPWHRAPTRPLSPSVLTVDAPLVAFEEVKWQGVVGHGPGDELAQHLRGQADGQGSKDICPPSAVPCPASPAGAGS